MVRDGEDGGEWEIIKSLQETYAFVWTRGDNTLIFNRFYLDSPLLNDFIRKYNLLGNVNVCVKQKRRK